VRTQNIALLFLILIVIGNGCLGASAGRVEYRDGLLSVQFEQAELERALEETSVATGVSFSVNPGVEGTVNQWFDSAPLEAGIRQLLVGYNYIMLYDEAGGGGKQVERVVVLGEVGERTEGSAPQPAPLRRRNVRDAVDVKRVSAPPRQLVLQRHPSGHYVAAGRINNAEVTFLVDTGATVVALSDELARRLRLRFGTRRTVQTANGRARGYETVLESVVLGELRMEQVRAVVLPDMKAGGRVLLGMSFLEGFEMTQRDGTLTIRQHPASVAPGQ
jgi:aspartyl protease family protein